MENNALNTQFINPLDVSTGDDDLIRDQVNFYLHLADNSLILSHRNSEWCGHGPVLEQDIALTNIALDLLGQARNIYEYAASFCRENNDNLFIKNLSAQLKIPIDNLSEDSLVFFRTEREFKNCLLVEQLNEDWGHTILRQFFFSTYQYLLYEQLQHTANQTIAAIAEKALKEVAYHVKWSSEWVIRLGDGTPESNKRMSNALEELWPFTSELFIPANYEDKKIAGFDLTPLKELWLKKVYAILEEATILSILQIDGEPRQIFMQTGGKQGVHSENMGYILTELQYIQRTYPNLEW